MHVAAVHHLTWSAGVSRCYVRVRERSANVGEGSRGRVIGDAWGLDTQVEPITSIQNHSGIGSQRTAMCKMKCVSLGYEHIAGTAYLEES